MTILKEFTDKKHREIEQLRIIQSIFSGTITKKEYVSYLYELYPIYSKLESLAIKAGLLVGLENLPRTNLIKEDLNELDPNYKRDVTKSTADYLNYLENLYIDAPPLLMAHIYVRHMGDLYGGKLMARNVPGSGKMFLFSDRASLIKEFNSKLYVDLAEEAVKAFDFFILIFKELEEIKE